MLAIGEQWDAQTWGQTESLGTVGDTWSIVQILAMKLYGGQAYPVRRSRRPF
ncbi:hypothetical protein K503DRAFT_806237 [Rhizopogon vinicolor AM-OR11-026]|uniref:Uncharacterized protein n=1 Tax=Rhizopogon vinicolor AM-OR11-026 TaxID=1314800 RepID=A0A1B7MF58_9AGAM|nr:hypothetical protein K503DRAFT_806237 [Rhizopogon vinicolor AM-OR11-026]